MIADRQPLLLVGFTQASSVMPVVRSRSLASGMLTNALEPLKLSARPFLPVVVRVAAAIAPVCPWPDTPVTVEPLGSSKLYAATGVGAGGALLSTVEVTGADVVLLPAASRATAVSACGPAAAAVVSQLTE